MDSATVFENPRNHRTSTFGRSSNLKPPPNNEFDAIKSAWNGNGSIWRNEGSFLDVLAPNEAIRQATPVRQDSTSSTKTSSTPLTYVNGHHTNTADHHTKINSTTTPWASGIRSDFRTRDSDFTSPFKQGYDELPVTGQHQEIESSSHLLLNSAPDFDGPINSTIQRKYQGNDNYNFPPNGILRQKSDMNDQFKSTQHSNFTKFMANNAISSTGLTKTYADESSPNTVRSDNYGFPNNVNDMSRSSLLLQEEAPASITWRGEPSTDASHFRTTPAAGNAGKHNRYNSYQNGTFIIADRHVELASTPMASLSLSNGNPGWRPSHATTYLVQRAQQPHQASRNRHHLSSQNSLSLDYDHHDSIGLVHQSSTLPELQVSRSLNTQPLIDYDNGSPAPSDHRSSFQSPYYSGAGTPPTGPESVRSAAGSGISSRTSYHDAVMLDRKLRSLEPYQSGSIYNQSNLFQGMTFNGSHSISAYQSSTRMNPLAMPYSVGGFLNGGSHTSMPRLNVREPSTAQVIRSPLLEEFRLNNKTNKRYELKDIYEHIVEFSGDQHGSRFIQQKLETANSDEKEQVFAEIQPNCLQLMTDVFGNYVIQKMFEHGNQSQKKMLANTMKGHVLNLSLQMYGCRVVQKAIEHVLIDQQASMVKELDGPNKQILKVIRDQNGNHVVQKAIERVPAEHIQFIVEAHRGEVVKLATHTYGCRVIQRILEHCQPPAKRIILDELHNCVQPLITDSFGNYVVQHIIQNGEPSDRRWVVSIVQQQLLIFSKHKFASNVVEKCIEYADEDQRAEMLRKLIGPNDQGQTAVLSLLRDQYGNYVIQKICSLLKGDELEMLIGEMRACFSQLRRTSYGKQVMAIEKLLYEASLLQNLPTADVRSYDFMSSDTNGTAARDVGTCGQKPDRLSTTEDKEPTLI